MLRQDRSHRDRDHNHRDHKKSMGRKPAAKFHLPAGTTIDYKEISLLQKYVTERGKILSRRFTGVSAKEQRQIVRSIKQARFLGLLTILGSRSGSK